MRPQVTLLLLAVVAALVAVLMFTREKAEEHGNVSVSLLGDNRLSHATRIKWQFDGMAPIEVSRTPGGPFRLTFPLEDLAAVPFLRSIAQTYDSAMIGETPLPDTEENRKRAGLLPPRVVVEVEFEDGRHQRLEIGAEGPLGTDVFIRRDGKIWRGGLALYSSLQVGIDDLREHSVFTTPADAAQIVTVDRLLPEGGREQLRLERVGDGWQLTEPKRVRADTAAADSFLRTLMALRIDSFPQGPILMPERPADIAIRVHGSLGDEAVDLWVDEQDNMYGQLPARKISFVVHSTQYANLFVNGIDALRARVLAPIADLYNTMATMAVEWGGDAPRLLLHRELDAQWLLQEPIAAPAEQTPANELLTAVNNLRALSFAPEGSDPQAFGIRPGGLSIAVQGKNDKTAYTIRFGNDGKLGADDITYAARAADGPTEIVAVPRGAVDVIRRPWTAYVTLQLLRITYGVSRVDLRRRDGTTRRLLADDAGKWSDPSGAAVRDDEIADYVDRIRDLVAKRVELARNLQLGEPDWTLTLGRSSEPAEAPGFGVLEVWDRADRSLIVRLRTGNRDLAAELTPTDSHVLRQLWQ